MLNWKIRSSHKISSPVSKEDVSSYQRTLDSNEIGFFRLPDNKELLARTKKVHENFQSKKFFIHIGIGGSALGPEMLLAALGVKTDTQFIFMNNIDPDDLSRKISIVDVTESLIYVVSKSGTTAETVEAMSILINELKKAGIKESEFKNYFVFCTDPEKGELRKLSHEWNVE